MSVTVTEVQIHPAKETDKVLAYASIVLDGCFVVRDLKVIDGGDRYFVAMPSKKMKDGSYRDTAHPINTQTRLMVERKVLSAFNSVISSSAS